MPDGLCECGCGERTRIAPTVTAERLGVHPSVICRVRSRKSWWPDPFMADDAGVWAARLEC